MARSLVLVCCAFLLPLLTEVWSAHYEPNWKSIDSRPLPAWYDKAKVGIFIHWGVFSVPAFGSEWFWWNWAGDFQDNYVKYMQKNYKPDFTYPEFAPEFTAEFYDPNEWATLFNRSGARYVVLTSKHHEGFTLWPSKYSFNWNAKDTGPGRDLIAPLASSVRAHGMHFGLYHSLYEWFNPMYVNDKVNDFKTNTFVVNKIRPEIEELVNLYKPDVIWSDGDWEAPDSYWNSTDFLAWLYNDSPVKDSVVTNDRWGQNMACHHGGFFTCTDRFSPDKLQPRKWENAMTIDRQSWGFRREATLESYLSTDELVAQLAQTVSCGGNMLINVGPTKYGKIAPIFEERLIQLGKWLGVNGEAIYESQPWKHQNDTVSEHIWYTQRAGNVYGIALKFPEKETLEFGAVTFDQLKSAYLLGVHGAVKTSKGQSGGTVVHFPELTPNDSVQYAFTFKFTFK